MAAWCPIRTLLRSETNVTRPRAGGYSEVFHRVLMQRVKGSTNACETDRLCNLIFLVSGSTHTCAAANAPMAALLPRLPADLVLVVRRHLTSPKSCQVFYGPTGWLIHLFLGDDSGFWIVPSPEQYSLFCLCRAATSSKMKKKSSKVTKGRPHVRTGPVFGAVGSSDAFSSENGARAFIK